MSSFSRFVAFGVRKRKGTEHLYAKRIRTLHTYTPTALKGNTPTDKTLKTPTILGFVRV